MVKRRKTRKPLLYQAEASCLRIPGEDRFSLPGRSGRGTIQPLSAGRFAGVGGMPPLTVGDLYFGSIWAIVAVKPQASAEFMNHSLYLRNRPSKWASISAWE